MAIHSAPDDWTVFAYSLADIISGVFARSRRVLLFGVPGVGKSTLAAELARGFAARGRACACLSADPGSPGFGIPGAASLATWRDDDWRVSHYEALCTLDAGRFRLPLISAVRRLARDVSGDVLLIDGPGVVRGVAGSELLFGLVDAADVDAVLVVTAAERAPPLQHEMHSLGLPVFVVCAHAEARRPGGGRRARTRTARWDAYLADGREQRVDLTTVTCSGTPPPRGVASAWVGRQIGFLQGTRTRTLGEVLRVDGSTLIVRAPGDITGATSLLVRDAVRDASGVISTAVPFVADRIDYLMPRALVSSVVTDSGLRVVGRVGALEVCLLNGVFGDPLLHAHLRFRRRSLLFDLGSGERLSAHTAHEVTDVFITHAHLDHIGGFVWLLRSRIGEFPACRMVGPPGLARNIAGFLDGILWDRVAGRAPRFEVIEVHGETLRRYLLEAGRAECALLNETHAPYGIVRDEPEFKVRAITLDHHTPVLAYAFEPSMQLNIRKDRLAARGFAPGPWLGALKQQVLAGDTAARITLPDGSESTVGDVAAELVLMSPGKKLVYATDFADTAENRRRLIELAKHAHTLFCEATFLEADAEQAARTGHLTTRACGEIAAAAEVARLVPFHFSRRYADRPQQVYAEISAVCPRTATPREFGNDAAVVP